MVSRGGAREPAKPSAAPDGKVVDCGCPLANISLNSLTTEESFTADDFHHLMDAESSIRLLFINY